MKILTAFTLLHCLAATASAHFIWLVPGESGGAATINVYFGEDASDDSADYLSRVKGISVFRVSGSEAATAVELVQTDDSISATTAEVDNCVYVASHDLGVIDRGESRFRLMYYAKTGPDASSKAWQTAICTDDLKLDVLPVFDNHHSVTVTVSFEGKPVAAAEVKVARPGAEDFEGVTNDLGVVTFKTADTGLYSIRARHIETTAGELNGQAFSETRHYSTVAFNITTNDSSTAATTSFQNLPQPVTSFGAAVADHSLFMYGGHTGDAHSYSTAEQSNTLTRLDLKTGRWETMAEGPHLQGLALVAHGGKLYRIGGFTAMNAAGEDHDLQSQKSVACFDPVAKTWTDLPELPEPRSSHDAAVVGDNIYVVGGWAMGDGDSDWHDTAWKMNLMQQPLQWEAISSPPFKRRALAAAAHNGRLYAVGGMQDKGGPTTAVAIYDPATDAWSKGPSLIVTEEPPEAKGEEQSRNMSSGKMAGFGASAFATGGALYVTTVQGNLQRLSDDGRTWQVVAEGISPRFFHRLLPLSDQQLIVVGGANMNIGKFEEVEVLNVDRGT